MNSRPLGHSDLSIPPVIFGAWAIGGWNWGGTDDGEAIRAIHASIDAGVTAIDTAPVYGFGHSESVVGRAIADRRDRVQVLTKVGLRWDTTEGAHFFDSDGQSVYRNLRPASIRAEVEASLRRMGIDEIDLIQCHWPDPSFPVEETMAGLAALVDEGKVRAVGVSNFDPRLLTRAKIALGEVPLASTQPRYSLLDRKIEADVLPWCRQAGVGAIVYSPIEQGLLSGKVTMDRTFPADDGRSRSPRFAPESRAGVLAALEQTADIAAAHNATPAQIAIAWCFHQPGVTAAIVGARSPQQAIENAAAGRITLSAAEIARLSQVFAG
ncbi:MAG: methylglyoxal reductase [Myxococcota bacterium]|jgi:methylglyoxal reductase